LFYHVGECDAGCRVKKLLAEYQAEPEPEKCISENGFAAD